MADERLVADRYLLHEPVGRGGMGVVWRGEDKRLGRSVAVKEVHLQPGLDGEEREAVQRRVMREARAAAMLNHSGAVTVYDVAEDDGQAYIVMELVEAPTLAECVKEGGPLPPADAARIGLAVLDVLAAAHAAGIVHRDLKPANVLVAGQDVKLTDFGIAQMKDDPRLTSTGIVLGSPSYIAPEQALGHDVTAATDIWGLGATLYYAVTGRPPFDRGEAIATLTAVTHDDLVVDPRAGAMAPVLEQMLVKDPAQRPAIADLRARLAAVAESADSTLALRVDQATLAAPAATAPVPVPPADEPAPVRTVSPTPPPPVVYRRRRWPWVALILLAILAGGVVAYQTDRLPGIGPGRLPGSGSGSDGEDGGGGGGDRVVVPQGWVTYEHPTQGWTIAHPAGWRVIPRPDRDNATDFREPGNTGRYLRVGMTNTPGDDVVGRWRESSRVFGASHDDYVEVRIEKADYRDYDAALWEYTYRDGNALHAYNLGFVTDGKGYALNFQTREKDWAESEPMFEQFKQAFRP